MINDWKNINWSAVLKSQIMQGLLGAFVCWLASRAGQSLPPDQQTKLVADLTEISQDAIPLLIGYATYHRATTGPATITTIVPKKDDNQNKVPPPPAA